MPAGSNLFPLHAAAHAAADIFHPDADPVWVQKADEVVLNSDY